MLKDLGDVCTCIYVCLLRVRCAKKDGKWTTYEPKGNERGASRNDKDDVVVGQKAILVVRTRAQ